MDRDNEIVLRLNKLLSPLYNHALVLNLNGFKLEL
jgi:hypothetical protein